jgi:hypothetical protein
MGAPHQRKAKDPVVTVFRRIIQRYQGFHLEIATKLTISRFHLVIALRRFPPGCLGF